MQLIKDYGVASGQKLNLEKTRMMFSANVEEEVKVEIAERLGVEVAENPETYLGIPTMWGKTKTVAMAFLKEKVQEKVQYWKQQTLSPRGNEILIKAVASAIPTYIMGCYKIPKKGCDKMNAVMANFWWGQRNNEGRIHWKSLTKSKMIRAWALKSLKCSIEHYLLNMDGD